MSDSNGEDTDLGPQPEPEITPREPEPGGPDANWLEEESLPADLDPDVDAAIPHDLPEELRRPEDTSTEATEGREETDQADESPA